jgi:hypothetical protein
MKIHKMGGKAIYKKSIRICIVQILISSGYSRKSIPGFISFNDKINNIPPLILLSIKKG